MFLPRKTSEPGLVGQRCRLNSASFWLVTLKPARSQRVCQPAFVVSMHVATAEPARPLVCTTQQSLSLWSKSLRHEQTRRIGSALAAKASNFRWVFSA
eukprot:scaffold6436_cov113-Isochrysis_galbana.AAC.12